MEAKLILNIGLNRASGGAISAEQARQTLAANEFLIVRDAVLESDTEPTLVAEVTIRNTDPFIFLQLLRRVAEELDQDCIAVYRELTGAGSLIGPALLSGVRSTPSTSCCCSTAAGCLRPSPLDPRRTPCATTSLSSTARA